MSISTLDTELAAAASRRWWNRWTIVLAVALLLVGGFVAGIEVQKAYGAEPTATGAGGGFRGQGGFTPPTTFPGGGPFGGGSPQGGSERAQATTGVVKLVDGTTIYVETESGDVVTVRTDRDTAVRVPGELKNLKAGDKVSVDGSNDAEGSVAASSVTKTK